MVGEVLQRLLDGPDVLLRPSHDNLNLGWPVAPLVVISILMLYTRLDKEEAMMLEQFGDAYRAYMRRTGRLLPRLIHRSD